MGFSGGGSNVLKPHKHDGTVVQDGGSLDFDNITQADLTAGDVIFSNGTHLQRLAIGTPAQQIKVNAGATAIEYFTPSAGGATLTRTTYSTSTVQTVSSLTMVDLTGFTATLQAGAGMATCNYCSTKIEGAQNGSMRWNFATDGVQPNLFVNDSGGHLVSCYGVTSTLSGQVCKMQGMVNGVGSIDFQGGSKLGIMYCLEIS